MRFAILIFNFHGTLHVRTKNCWETSLVLIASQFPHIIVVSFSYLFLYFRTLSPMASFTSELGVHFETSLEAPHVIDVDSQVLTTSPLVLLAL